MEQKIVNFQKFEIVADSRNEAIEQIENEKFGILGDATQAYKNAKKAATNGWTDRDEKLFCMEYLEKKTKMKAGVGFLVTKDSAVADNRERPYKFTNVKNEDGKRKIKKTLTWIDKSTGMTILEVHGTKTDAANAMKELYKSGEYKGDAECRIVYNVTEGNPIVMESEYTPSKNTRKGTYLAFGVQA